MCGSEQLEVSRVVFENPVEEGEGSFLGDHHGLQWVWAHGLGLREMIRQGVVSIKEIVIDLFDFLVHSLEGDFGELV